MTLHTLVRFSNICFKHNVDLLRRQSSDFFGLRALGSFTFKMDACSWKAPVPCKVGDLVQDIDTPALIVDMDKLGVNLKAMPQIMEKFPSVAVRPHAKAHKCPHLAKMQVEHGAVGMCCQTLTEAEAMVYGGGTTNILVSNQLIGKAKLRRLAALIKHGAKVSLCVDSIGNIEDISAVAVESDVNIACVVEVNVGQNRCGVEPGEPAVELAQVIQKLPGVTFAGIQCYHGINQHVRKSNDRQKAVDSVVALTQKTLQALNAAGIQCTYVTGGGTGTFVYEAASGVFTEVQPGSYVFMDADYGRNYGEDGGFFKDFQQSLYVLSTVQSVLPGVRAVVDAGMKAASLDSGPPLVSDHPDLVYTCGGDEHGILMPPGDLKVGDQVWLTPGHCDPTVNLYDWLVGVRQGRVEHVWPVLGRGPGV